MDSVEFLKELEEHLAVLPEEIRKAALAFYTKQFEEVGEAGESGLLLELGNPYTLAKNIIAENSEYTSGESYINLKKDFPELTSEKPERKPEWDKPIEPNAELEREISLSSKAYYAEKAINAYKTQAEYDKDPKPKIVVTPEKGVRYAPPPKPPKKGNAAVKVLVGAFIAFALMLPLLFGLVFIVNRNQSISDYVDYGPIQYPVEYAETVMPVPYEDVTAYAWDFEGVVNAVDIKNEYSTVTIIKDGYFKVESDTVGAESDLIDVSFNEGKLTVGAKLGAGNVTVHIPNSIDGEISISSTGGTVSLFNMIAGKTSINATASSVSITDTTFLEDFNYNGTMTDLNTNDTVFDKNSDFNVTGGSVFLRGKFFGNVKADLTSSSIDFSIEQKRDLWKIDGTADYHINLVDGSYYGSNDYPQPQNPPYTMTIDGVSSNAEIFFGIADLD
jgi:hypothetical protein